MEKHKTQLLASYAAALLGPYQYVDVRFLSADVLALKLRHTEQPQYVLQLRQRQDFTLLLTLQLAEYGEEVHYCAWGNGLALLSEQGLWRWASLTDTTANFYPLHNPQAFLAEADGRQYVTTPLQLMALDEQQLLLRMSAYNSRKGRALSWLFINEDGQCHITNRYKELDEPEVRQLIAPDSAYWLWLGDMAVRDGTIWCLCSGDMSLTFSENPAVEHNYLLPYRYELPRHWLSSLSKLLGAGQQPAFLLQAGITSLPAGNAFFANSGSHLWLRERGKNRLQCFSTGQSQAQRQISITPAQNLGQIPLRQALLNFWDDQLLLLHNAQQLNLCQVLPHR